MKKNHLLIIVGLLGIGLLLLNLPVNGANTILSQVINPGTLKVSAPNSSSFTMVDLDDLPDIGATTNATITPVKIKDHRAGSPGWSVTQTCEDFISGSDTIAVTNLTVNPSDLTAVGNTSLTGVSKGSAHNFTGTTDPATLATATTGSGQGRFSQDEGLELFIDVATVPGTYNATSTITIS